MATKKFAMSNQGAFPIGCVPYHYTAVKGAFSEMKNIVEILVRCDLFNDMDNKEIESLLTCLNPIAKDFDKGNTVVTAGGTFTGIGIVLSGVIAVVKEGADGSRLIMNILSSGDIFGEIIAFSSVSKWPANVYANQQSSVLFLSPDKLINLCENVCGIHDKLIRNFIRIVSERALLLNRKVEYLVVKSMRGKLCKFFYEQYNNSGQMMFRLPMDRESLADFLNVSRPSMSRELSRMKDEGIIDFFRSSIQIKDIEKLKKFL